MRIKPFIHRAKNWGGYYRLVFLDDSGRLLEHDNIVDYKVKSDYVEYTKDDNISRATHNRLIAIVEIERL